MHRLSARHVIVILESNLKVSSTDFVLYLWRFLNNGSWSSYVKY